MVNTNRRLSLLFEWGRKFFESKDSTEEPQRVEEDIEVTTEDPESEPMTAYWETDQKELSNRNQKFIDLYRKGKALERIPDTTERPVKESQYLFAKLFPASHVPDIFNINAPGVQEPSKPGTGISSNGRDAGVVAGIVIAVISGILILAALIAVVMYKHYVHRNATSMNFDNPVYRKTTEDQFALEKNGYAPGSKLYPSTVGEEAQEPLNTPGTNDFV